MRFGKVGYYLDFVVYPVMIAGLATFLLWRASPMQFGATLAAFVFGIAGWTLVEYTLHRFVLHRFPYIREMHGNHHSDQTALVGAPLWVTLVLFTCLIYLPLQLALPALAGGLTVGFMAGYLWYFSVHHLIHHGGVGHSAYAERLQRRHMLHHHFDDEGNFGVTSGIWDRIFGTDVQIRGSGGSRNGSGS